LVLALSMLAGVSGCSQEMQKESASGQVAKSEPGLVKNTQPIQAPEYTLVQNRPDRLIATLPNGMIVIAQELKTAPVVSCQVWIKTGSVFEQEHTGAGLSHFLEHLLSGGTTTTRTEDQTNTILGQIGANVNASTGLDTVKYYVNVSKPHTDTAIDLLSDWMQNSKITPEEYARERDVIQREFDMGAGEPNRIFWKLTQMNRFKYHPARHPTIGYLDEFLKISRDEIYAFYKRMYVPNNMVFVVVGDIDKKRVVDRISRQFKDAKPGALPEIKLPEDDKMTGPVTASETADIDKARLRLAWPGTRMGAPNDYALDLLSTILGQGEAARLTKTIRDQDRLVNSIGAYNLSFAWGEGYFAVDAVLAPKPGQSNEDAMKETKAAILGQIKTIIDKGVTNEELDRAKRQVKAAAAYEGQSVESVANRLASDMINSADPDYVQDYARKVQSLTPAELQAAAKKYLVDGSMMTLTLFPKPKDQKPTEMGRPADGAKPDGVTWEKVDLDNKVIIKRYEEIASKRKEEVKAIQVDAPELFTLSNGLRVVVQRSTLVPAISMQYYTIGGLLADAPEREGVVNASMSMLTKGTKTRTKDQISETLENIGAGLDAQAGNNSTFVRATCLAEDLETVSSLFADVILNPSFPQEEWAKIQPRMVAGIKSQNDSWSGELRQKFRNMYYGDFVLSQTPMGRAEVIEKLNAKELQSFYAQGLGAQESVLVIVGDIQPAAAKALAEKLFKGLPKKPAKPFKLTLPANPVSRVDVSITAKPLAAVQIGFGPGVDRKNPDFAPIQVLTRVLSSWPTGWLDQELRGKGPGLVYAVGAGSSSGLLPGYFAMLFNTKADSVPEAMARAMQVVQRAQKETISIEDLSRARTSLIVDEFFAKQTNEARATEFGLAIMYDMGLDEQTKFMNQIQAVTSADLKRVAQKYLVNPVGAVIANKPIPEPVLKDAFEGKPPGK
jgi:zinc protease